MKLYGTFRQKFTQKRDMQTISYYFDNELADYKEAGIMSIQDGDINDEQYTQYLAPGLKSQTRFFIAEYNENVVPAEYVDLMRNKITNDFYGIFFVDAEAARVWLRTNTNCVEGPTGTFLVTEPNQELENPAVYYVID